jgi:hypothetical protein
MLGLLTGCSPFSDRDATEPEPTPSRARDTVDAAPVGTRLAITATVASVINPASFVVKDADLPPEGLLVLDVAAPALHPSDLVTIDGDVTVFSFAGFAARYGLTEAGRYGDFEGRKAVEARDVRSWAEPSR